MSGEVEIRFAEPSDTEPVVQMIRRSLGPTMTPRLWRWKHVESPFGVSPVLLARDDQGIAAVRAFMRWRWTAGGREVAAVRAVDTATRPDRRGEGLFTRLTERLAREVTAEGARFVFNTPNSNSLPGYLRLGWSRVTRIPLRLAPRPLRILGRGTRGSGGEEDLERILAVGRPVEELLEAPGLPGLLAAATRPEERRLATAVDLPYLRWRYAEAPSGSYRAVWDLEEDGCAALIFRARWRGRFAEILVSEIVTSGHGGIGRAAGLLRRLKRAPGADYLAAVAPRDTPAGRALRRAGCLPALPVGPLLTARPLALRAQDPDPLHWRNWCCSLGDLEVF